ncbi:MAG: 4'-phosphopantetheinyl transferase superfamily protein [Chloroflexota bacterium]
MDDRPLDIWMIPLHLDLPESLPLSAEEWERAQRFFPEPRRMFMASHYGLRCILASYLQIKPEQVEFQVDAYRKPSLRGISNLNFNLTHSAELALCAVVWGKQIGVDVEIVRPIAEMDDIAAAHFSREEYQQFSRLPLSEKEEAFLALWTRKEAFLKAMGHGLCYPLDRFRVPLEASAIDQRLSILDDLTGAALDWSLYSFRPASDYVAAVVVEGEVDLSPTLYRFPDDL